MSTETLGITESHVESDNVTYVAKLERTALTVATELGAGLSEALYRNAMAIGMRKEGCHVSPEVIIPVEFQGEVIGNLRADLIVDKTHVVELKVAPRITNSHISQAEAYLMRMPPGATGHVVNFGSEQPQVVQVAQAELPSRKRKRDGSANLVGIPRGMGTRVRNGGEHVVWPQSTDGFE